MTKKTCKTLRNCLYLVTAVVFLTVIIGDMIYLTDLWVDKQDLYDTYLQFYVSSRLKGSLAVSYSLSLIPLAPAVYFHIRYRKSKTVAIEEASK